MQRYKMLLMLQSIVLNHIFSADQVSCRSYVGSVYRMRSIAVCVSSYKARFFEKTKGLAMQRYKMLLMMCLRCLC